MPPEVVVEEHIDDQGRRFPFVRKVHPGSRGLVVHFSAFFFEPSELHRTHRSDFSGYFHRLRMLGDDATHDWLFVCDIYGADGDGTYYLGERGDLFVRRGIDAVLDKAYGEWGYETVSTVMVGSSMGGTGALWFGLDRNVRGIATICPHIDLDICAARTNRTRHVAAVCPDGDPSADHNRELLRGIRNLLSARGTGGPLPALFVQSCADDAGVHEEQVVPLVNDWKARGGTVYFDVRATGGHTSDYATRSLLRDAVTSLVDGRAIDVARYQRMSIFSERPRKSPWRLRSRRWAGRLVRRVLPMWRRAAS